ncbi:hypothetical protein PENSPDRAFT_753025 [Peniophora sp. CONT]|nr:hypothetical protein PENSPDRAFT_753025 [Peniophora sp. CONT]
MTQEVQEVMLENSVDVSVFFCTLDHALREDRNTHGTDCDLKPAVHKPFDFTGTAHISSTARRCLHNGYLFRTGQMAQSSHPWIPTRPFRNGLLSHQGLGTHDPILFQRRAQNECEHHSRTRHGERCGFPSLCPGNHAYRARRSGRRAQDQRPCRSLARSDGAKGPRHAGE